MYHVSIEDLKDPKVTRLRMPASYMMETAKNRHPGLTVLPKRHGI